MNAEDLIRTGLLIVYGDTDSCSVSTKYRRHQGWLARVMTNEILEDLLQHILCGLI